MSGMCQSCSMPMSKDPTGGGKNIDGSISTKYCGHCFQDGEFVAQNIGVKEFQACCVKIMSEQGWPRPLAWLMTRGIPKLERWPEN